MFEKEAEEYGKENCAIQKNGLCTFVDSERTSQIWKDGAEFGYNKANEWHKPSEKLPEECTLVLAYLFEAMLLRYRRARHRDWMSVRSIPIVLVQQQRCCFGLDYLHRLLKSLCDDLLTGFGIQQPHCNHPRSHYHLTHYACIASNLPN